MPTDAASQGTGGITPAGAYRPSLTERLGRWIFYLPIVFMMLFFALPMGLTVVFSVFERTMFWMEPGFSLQAYENFFFSARLKNFLSSMYYSAIAVVICFVIPAPTGPLANINTAMTGSGYMAISIPATR